MTQQNVSLDILAKGAIKERFDDALQEVLKNIADPNTDQEKARKIVITAVVTPTTRGLATIKFDTKSTLLPPVPVETSIMYGNDGERVIVNEVIEEQMTLFNEEKQDKVTKLNSNSKI